MKFTTLCDEFLTYIEDNFYQYQYQEQEQEQQQQQQQQQQEED